MSIRTERAYLRWIESFLRFEKARAGCRRHPMDMGSREVNRYLTHLAVERNVAASTQNQAFSALLFLFQNILDQSLVIDATAAKVPKRLPVVLSREEVRRVFQQLPPGLPRLCAGLMYGSGLRLTEACRLRVKDVDFGRRQITVRNGKGDKDRGVPLPGRLADRLRQQLQDTRALHLHDLDAGAGYAWLPHALARK